MNHFRTPVLPTVPTSLTCSNACRVLALASSAAIAALSSIATAQCSPPAGFASVMPQKFLWCIDSDLDGLFDHIEQWGTPSAAQYYLAGEPASGVGVDGMPLSNGYDDLMYVAPHPADPNLMEWWFKANDLAPGCSGYYRRTQFGLWGDKIFAGNFSGFGQSIAIVRSNTELPGMSFFIWDVNRNMSYDHGLDPIYDEWQVLLGDQDRVFAGNWDSLANDDLVVWRRDTGVWEFYYVWIGMPGNTWAWTAQFGTPADVPIMADFNGDGRKDIAVFRPATSYLYVNLFENGDINGGFGIDGDVDLAIDYSNAIREMNQSEGLPANTQWQVASMGITFDHVGVFGPPSVQTSPYSQNVCIGHEVVLTAQGAGNGPLAYIWRKGGEFLHDGPTPYGSVISGSTTSQLRIFNTQIEDMGEAPEGAYDCVISNSCGAVITNHATLGICHPDIDCSGFVDTDDFDAFVALFEEGTIEADFDRSGFVDTDDFDAFVLAFEAGC